MEHDYLDNIELEIATEVAMQKKFGNDHDKIAFNVIRSHDLMGLCVDATQAIEKLHGTTNLFDRDGELRSKPIMDGVIRWLEGIDTMRDRTDLSIWIQNQLDKVMCKEV